MSAISETDNYFSNYPNPLPPICASILSGALTYFVDTIQSESEIIETTGSLPVFVQQAAAAKTIRYGHKYEK